MSSSTFVAESSEDKDDQLIIIVNADGTITVDPETLQKLLTNQHHRGNLSILRVGQGNSTPDNSQDDEDGGSGPHINLTVEGFYSGTEPEILPSDMADGINEVVDPFSQMEPEHIARLESVLQSDQAKEILGTNLEDNLNSMLDILEPQEEAPRSVVHNDHSYTAMTLPVFQQPQSQPQLPTIQQHRPLTRGARTRGGRGRGVLTRGGSRGTAPILVATSAPPTVILSPTKGIQSSPQKTFILTQAPQRVVPQPQPVPSEPVLVEKVDQSQPAPQLVSPEISQQTISPATPRVIQRKIIVKTPQPQTPQLIQHHPQPQLKQQTLHQSILSPQPSIVSPKDVGITRTGQSVIVLKKGVSPTRGRGRGGRGSRGGRRSRQSPTTPTVSVAPPPVPGDEVSAALQAMELSPSPDTSPPSHIFTPKAETSETVLVGRKKTPTVIIRKLSTTKSEIVSSSPDKSRKVHRHSEENEELAGPLVHQDPSPKGSLKQSSHPKTPETPTSSRVSTKEATSINTDDSHSSKKKKEKKSSVAAVVVDVPELFSTPDIIRRVSTDKQGDVAVPSTPRTPPVQPEPKVQVQPTHPPFKPTNCDVEMTPESLLDSIHAEVAAAKDDSRLLAEALLLDDLTNDDSMSYPGKEKHEDIKLPQTTENQSPKIKSVENTIPNLTPKVRKLPPIELPTTRSASKKAQSANQPTIPVHSTAVTTPASSKTVQVEKDKRHGSSASVTEKRPSGEIRKSPQKKYSLKEDFVSDFEDEELESDEESVNSEDDPNRLWCICKQPHNNRFMICCDGCEEWFHGKCVGVTKAMGRFIGPALMLKPSRLICA